MDKINEWLIPDAALDLRMNREDMEAAVGQKGKDTLPSRFHAQFLKTGQIGWNFRYHQSLMEKGFPAPRTAQIVKAIVADDLQNPIIYQPGRGAEGGRVLPR